MIIIHDIFVCKPGNASKVAKMFKTAMANSSELVQIMTDMTGPYNKVVMVSQYENLAAYEKSWEKYKENTEEMKKMTEAMAGYQDMYLTGSREIPGLVDQRLIYFPHSFLVGVFYFHNLSCNIRQ